MTKMALVPNPWDLPGVVRQCCWRFGHSIERFVHTHVALNVLLLRTFLRFRGIK